MRTRLTIAIGAALTVGVVVALLVTRSEPGEEPPPAAASTLQHVTYETAHVPGSGGSVEKGAMVYLPAGYDGATRHDIVYLMHGASGDEYSWLGRPSDPSGLPDVLDRMIADGVIGPTIVVAPTFDTGMDTIGRNADAFHDELVDDLLPRIEGSFGSYADGTTPAQLAAARDHRVFGGFSMGGVTTWHVFTRGLDQFAGFLPMSGDSWSRGKLGGRDQPDATARDLAEAATGSGFAPDDYAIVAATGTDDWALRPLTRQVEAMRSRPEAFTDDNLRLDVVAGNTHDYESAYDYLVAALPRLLDPTR